MTDRTKTLFLLGTIGSCFASLLFLANVSRAAVVGDEAEVRFVCEKQETVETQINVAEAGGKEAVNAQFLADVESGACAILPSVIAVEVEAVGNERKPFKYGEDTIKVQAVKVRGVWTVTVEALPPTT